MFKAPISKFRDALPIFLNRTKKQRKRIDAFGAFNRKCDHCFAPPRKPEFPRKALFPDFGTGIAEK